MTTLNCEFTRKLSLEERKVESEKILAKYPDRAPAIIVQASKSDLPPLDSSKFLIPRDLTVGHFIYVLRTKIKMRPEQAIFMFVNGVLPTTTALVGTIYDKHKAEDGFLYFTITSENVFGGQAISSNKLSNESRQHSSSYLARKKKTQSAPKKSNKVKKIKKMKKTQVRRKV